MRMEATIEVTGLRKRFGPAVALDGVSFTVLPGRVTGFVGPNGAGKSTTMRMIAGLDEPTAGRVRVNGRDYRAASACSRPRRCTPAGRPAITCWRWPRPTASADAALLSRRDIT